MLCRISEYLELESRVELLNSRFNVLQVWGGGGVARRRFGQLGAGGGQAGVGRGERGKKPWGKIYVLF